MEFLAYSFIYHIHIHQKLLFFLNLFLIQFSYFRLKAKIPLPCAIPDPGGNEFIMTGGSMPGNIVMSNTEVSVYNEDGWKENLMPLNKGRWSHGCTSFIKDGKMVCI